MRLSKKYEGSKILCEYTSSNIKVGTYDTNTKSLVIEFNNGSKYQYDEVPHDVFSEFDIAESQGKYFNANIAKKYTFKKI